MPDLTGVGPFLSTLRMLPVWLLGGAAAAGFAVLLIPAFGNIDPTNFRTQWGVWVWVEAILFTTLTFARWVDIGVTTYLTHRKNSNARRVILLSLAQERSWWHLAKQQDDSYCSQIALSIDATNLSDRPIRFTKARIIRPKAKGEVLNCMVLLPAAGSPYHSDKHPVPPHDTITASLHIMVRGVLAQQGKPLRLTIGMTDQYGEEYQLKRIVIRTQNSVPPKPPWRTRIVSSLREVFGFTPKTHPARQDVGPPPAIWDHQGKFAQVDLVLIDERRNYAANGRIKGGLGSLNVNIQSTPNLCDLAQAKLIESPNVARLIKLHATLDDAGKTDLQQYLLSHLHNQSPYADVAYLIYLALHRMNRTIEAINAARANLVGDKVFGYSNMLGTLSAVISNEYLDIDPNLYPRILEALAGDPEYNFQLTEKINLARLRLLDLELKERLNSDSNVAK